MVVIKVLRFAVFSPLDGDSLIIKGQVFLIHIYFFYLKNLLKKRKDKRQIKDTTNNTINKSSWA